jgi:hypothetical protein
MSFTFDDISRQIPVNKSVKLDRLAQRIEQLRSKGKDDPEINEKISALEQRRQQLLNKHAYGMKAPQLQPRAAEDGMVGDGGNAIAAVARLQRAAQNKLGRKLRRR